ncbi:MAG: YdcF family protein [Leptolyngbya sp. SIO4C1]|nr:YdcF family protein [Leptolyngbya sp. SIO4C1]
MLELLTRVLLWAAIGLLVWYLLIKIVPPKYLRWFGGVVILILLAASFIEPNDDTIGLIWQLLSLPLRPLSGSLLLLGFALSDGWKNAKGRQVALALTILLFTSMPVVARALVAQSEQAVADAYETRRSLCEGVCPVDIPEAAGLGQARAIVVIGDSNDAASANALFRNQDETAYNSALVPRLIYAANLYEQSGSRPFVIVTAGPDNGESLEAEKRQFLRSTLTRNGVRGEDIELVSTGLNVRDSANEVEDFLEDRRVLPDEDERNERDAARVVLVAPALSMARTALTFEKEGMEVIARPTDFYTSGTDGDDDLLEQLPDILPDADALALTSRYWNEFLASIYYFLRGWLPGFNFGWDSNIEI